VVADGFSCRQQIAHGTARRAMHTAEVLQMAIQHNREPLAPPRKGSYIERGHTQPEPSSTGLVALAGAAAAGGLLYLLTRQKAQTPQPTIAQSHEHTQMRGND
jgi:hypothetical protein